MPPYVQKALEASIADGKLHEDLVDRYWRENMPVDAAKSSRLHDSLVLVLNSSKELSPVFLQALVRLAPCLINKDQLRFWFAKLAPIGIDSGGKNNVLVSLCREFIGEVLDGNHDDELSSIYHENTVLYIGLLMDVYVGKPCDWIKFDDLGPGAEERRRYVRANVRDLLLQHGVRDLEALLNVMYQDLQVPKNRILLLQLLSELVSEQLNGKLFKIANTPVLGFLIKCIERDRSNISVEIASTTLAMVLPHVTDKLVDLLPRLLACYGRMSSWLPSVSDSVITSNSQNEEEENVENSDDWQVLEPISGVREPNPAPLFNILYGLFPNNTLQFCRQPDDYLSKANYKLPFSTPWDRFLILEKTQALLPQFTLHSLLLTSTAEQEIATASARFQRLASAAGIMFMCTEMRVAGADADDSALPIYGSVEEQDVLASMSSLLSQHQQLFLSNIEQGTASSILPPGGRYTRETSAQPYTPSLKASSPAPSTSSIGGAATPGAPSTSNSTSTTPRVGGITASMSSPSSPIVSQAENTVAQATPAIAAANPPSSERRGRGSNRDRSTSNASLRLRQSMSPGPRLTANLVGQSSPMSAGSTQPTLPGSQSSLIGATFNDERRSHYTSAVDYYVRELLLNKNELDFANFTRYIVERKVVRLQKQLYELSMAKIRIEYLSGENKKLSVRLSKIEEEHSHAQRVARTRLRDRTAYETTLLDKNRELRQQLQETKVDLESRIAEIERLTSDRDQLTQELHELASQIPEDCGPRDNSLPPSTTSIAETNGNDTPATSIEVGEYEAKYYEALSELEACKTQFEQEMQPLRDQVRALKQELQDDRQKLEDRIRKLQLSAKSIASEVQAHEAAKFAQLQAAHSEQSARFATLERELMARRVHEEEQLSELRTTLLLSRPFSLQESEIGGETRIRGRGGAQGTVRR